MRKWKRPLVIFCVVLIALIGVGIWAFSHWLGFMLIRPMPVEARYDWPLTIVAGDGAPGFSDGASPRFNKPIRLAPFGRDTVLVADINNHALRIVHRDGKTETLAGGPGKKGHADGLVEHAQFNSPHGVAVRDDGAIAVAEAANHTVRLLMPTARKDAGADNVSAYTVYTLAGVAGKKGFKDGPAATAMFNAPHAVAWGANGVLFVADIGNSRLRQIKEGVVSTLAGTGRFGYRDGPLGEGTLQYPMDLSLTSDGSLLIADAGTGRIRCYAPGKGLFSPWPNIRIDMPHGLSTAPDGGLVVAEMYGHRIVMLTHDDKIIRLCGTGKSGSGARQLKKPAAVIIHSGHLWIADLDNHRILTAIWPPGLGR